MQSQSRTIINEPEISSVISPKTQDYPLGIDEFIKKSCVSTEFNIGTIPISDLNENFDNTEIVFARENDAATITEFHNVVYEGNYPYHEMLDVEYIKKRISDKENNSFCIYRNIKEDKPAGCLIAQKTKNPKSGYLRGLMVLPDQRDRISFLKGVEFVREAYKREKNYMDKWYSESRTAHSAAQHFFSLCGHRICAIFPNKDVFFGGNSRESDALTVAYSNRALYGLRNENPKLIPEFNDLFDHIKGLFSLGHIKLQDSDLEINDEFLKKTIELKENILVNIYEGEFNNDIFFLRTQNGSSIKFLITRTIKSAEFTELKIKSPLELAGLLMKLDEIIELHHIEYFECYLPSTNVDFQKVFLQFNFSVFGYLPAWDKNDGEFLDDCIIFGKYKKDLEPSELNLLPLGFELLSILKPFLH